MESGDEMISEKLTNLMNAVRSKYALTDKLSVDDATGYINKPELSNVVDGNFAFQNNNSSSTFIDGVFKIVAAGDDLNLGVTGPFMYYDKTKIKSGHRYSFTTFVRGNMQLYKLGEEHNLTIDSKAIPLSSTDWKIITFNFIAKSDIILYGIGKKGDWMEIKNWYFSELGGVIRKHLADLLPSRMEVAA